MTQSTDSDFQRLILERLDKIDQGIQTIKATLDQPTARLNQRLNQRLDQSHQGRLTEVKQRNEDSYASDDNFGRSSRRIIIATAAVMILSPLLQALVPAIATVVEHLIGG